jgi:hypothetical protein
MPTIALEDARRSTPQLAPLPHAITPIAATPLFSSHPPERSLSLSPTQHIASLFLRLPHPHPASSVGPRDGHLPPLPLSHPLWQALYSRALSRSSCSLLPSAILSAGNRHLSPARARQARTRPGHPGLPRYPGGLRVASESIGRRV